MTCQCTTDEAGHITSLCSTHYQALEKEAVANKLRLRERMDNVRVATEVDALNLIRNDQISEAVGLIKGMDTLYRAIYNNL